MPNFMAVGSDRLWLPEPLRWDAERPVEARGCVLPRDDHRQLRDGVVGVVPLHAREQLVVDVAARVRDRVGVFERHLLRVRSEEHTSELQSLAYLVCRLLLEKKKYMTCGLRPGSTRSSGVGSAQRR